MIICCLFCTVFHCFEKNLGLTVLKNKELVVKNVSKLNIAEEFSYVAEEFFNVLNLVLSSFRTKSLFLSFFPLFLFTPTTESVIFFSSGDIKF